MLIMFKRFGHANNSSSSHSIIFTPHLNIKDRILNDQFTYGWEEFVLNTRRAKEEYLLVQCFMGLLNREEPNEIKRILKSHPKSSVFDHLDEIINQLCNAAIHSDYNVDHQSVLHWPYNVQTNQQDIDFYFEFCNEILSNPYTILGGNDNSDGHPLQDKGFKHDFITIYEMLMYGEVNCVKDPLTREWTVSSYGKYGKHAGSIIKLVFSSDLPNNLNLNDPKVFFSNNNTTFFQKSSYPYLVDLKITSYCNYGCEFCYTSSVNTGQHADHRYIIDVLIPVLKEANVFEVVLGGGEPTVHPHLLEIVEAFKEQGFKIGITTKNYDFNKHPKYHTIVSKVNSVAVSINSLSDYAKSIKMIASARNDTAWYAQMILGLQEWKDTVELIKEICITYENITLLGYKRFGFGNNIKQKLIDKNWYKELKELSDECAFNVGIDSILANKYREELLNHDVEWNYLVGAEGKASCYIDAVERKIAASSFTDKQQDMPTNTEYFLKVFKTF